MIKKLKKKYIVWRLDKYAKTEKERGFLNTAESEKMLKLRDELYTMMWGRNIGFWGTHAEGAPWTKSGRTEIDMINEDQVEVLPTYYDEKGTQKWEEDKPIVHPPRLWIKKNPEPYVKVTITDSQYVALSKEQQAEWKLVSGVFNG